MLPLCEMSNVCVCVRECIFLSIIVHLHACLWKCVCMCWGDGAFFYMCVWEMCMCIPWTWQHYLNDVDIVVLLLKSNNSQFFFRFKNIIYLLCPIGLTLLCYSWDAQGVNWTPYTMHMGFIGLAVKTHMKSIIHRHKI